MYVAYELYYVEASLEFMFWLVACSKSAGFFQE